MFGALFGWLEQLLTGALQALMSVTGSVGWAVILLTVLVRVILHPLTRFSLKSMKRMQELAPQVAVLRRKYKDDQKQANIEIMNLYRSSGANPFGGCLPMLIQLPLLIAFYRVLVRPEVFAGQTFFGIALGSSPCPATVIPGAACLARLGANPVLAVLPVLVGLSMYIQQRMTVSDPQQARLFVFMPIIFGLFSLGFPAGLSVYWILTTVLYIAEYYIVVGRPVRAAPPVRQEARPQRAGGPKKQP